MKIIVGIKRVVDYNVHVRVKKDGTDVALDHVKMSMNPFDEIALEEAVQLREKGRAHEVIAVSIGNEQVQETLRTALAMGADRAIWVASEQKSEQKIESLDIAKILQKLVIKEEADLVLLGKQAIDDDHNQVGQMLSALLEWGQACFASQINIEEDEVIVTCEMDLGTQQIAVRLPAIVTVDLRLNEPRYVTLPNIMKAKRKPIEQVNMLDLNIEPQTHLAILKLEEPPMRGPADIVGSIAELIEKLHHDIKNISG